MDSGWRASSWTQQWREASLIQGIEIETVKSSSILAESELAVRIGLIGTSYEIERSRARQYPIVIHNSLVVAFP